MHINRVAVLLLVCTAAPILGGPAAAQETLRYKIVSNDTVAGTEVDKFSVNGRIDSAFEFNDRGRGPKIAATYLLGAGGLPLRTDVTGNDYLKAPVDEHFAFEQGRSHCKSTSEDGSSPAEGLYVSNNGPGAEFALLVAALVKAKGGPVKLLPAGEARLEGVTGPTLGDPQHNLHITPFTVTGPSLDPHTVRRHGQPRLFA